MYTDNSCITVQANRKATKKDLRGNLKKNLLVAELEREYSSTLPSAKSIYKSLTHEKPHGDTDCYCDHSTSNINAVAVRGDTSCLRKSRLIMVNRTGIRKI